MAVLTGNKLKLRAPEPEDLDLLYIWENDPEVWQISNTLTPFSRFTLKNYIENAHLDIYQAKQVRFMIDTLDTFSTIGTIDLFDFDPLHSRAGVGILIADNTRRKQGYAAEALDLLLDYCFSTLLLHQLYCNISSDNIASIGLFNKKGFVECGEKKEWIKTRDGWQSEFLYQLIRK
jgi:diamine N-acetyltransferase